jgi:hypothetical protein
MDFISIIILCGIASFFVSSAIEKISEKKTNLRIACIERKVDLLIEHFNIDYTNHSVQVVRNCLLDRQKTKAIQIFLELNPQVSLLEAQRAVRQIERELMQNIN